MSILITGFMMFLVAFILHVLCWRLTKVKRTPRNIILIFAICYGAIIAALVGFEFQIWWLAKGHIALPHATLLAFALFCGYLLTYPGVESDSPSNTMLLEIEKAGENGCDRNTLISLMSDEKTVLERTQGLARDGLIVRSHEQFMLTPKGGNFLRFFTTLRKLFTDESFGG